MRNNKRKILKLKEKKDFFWNLFKKNLVLFIFSSLLLLLVLQGEYHPAEGFFASVQMGLNPLCILIGFVLVFFILSVAGLIVFCALSRLKQAKNNEENYKTAGSESNGEEPNKRKPVKVLKWIGKNVQVIKKFLIWGMFFLWLLHALLKSTTLLSIVGLVASAYDPTIDLSGWAESLAWYCLVASYVTAIFLLLVELWNISGLDYLKFGNCSFYRGGRHWYEEEKKFLDAGDYGFLGKIVYNICIWVDNIRVLVDKICAWLDNKIFGKKILEEIWLLFCKLFDLFVTIIEKIFRLEHKSVGERLYQLYILFRYNSLFSRILNIVIIVFVGLNLWYLLQGGVPPWSYWWDSTGRIGNFINASTTLQIFLRCPLDNLSFLVLFGLIVEKGPRKAFLKSFLYERLNGVIVVVSTIVAILLVIANVAQRELMAGLLFADAMFTVIFLVEIGLKIFEDGRKFFIKDGFENASLLRKIDGWNVMDALVVLASITSIFMLKDEYQQIDGMLAMIVFRVVRLLKLLRLLKMFKKYLTNLFDGVKHALIKSIPIIMIFGIGLMILGFVLYLFSAEKGIGEEYFTNPIKSVFSLFQLFTYDGWNLITNNVSAECQRMWPDVWWVESAVRIVFCILVFAGGIVGVALLNSVFVDGMLLRDKSDEDRTKRLNDLARKIEEVNTKLDDMEKRRLQG